MKSSMRELGVSFQCEDVRGHKLMIVFSGAAGRPPDYMALVNIKSMMAHVLLSQARNAPKVAVSYTSKLPWSMFGAQLTMTEYDKVAPETKTKDWYYTEAAASLNGADETLRMVGAGVIDEEPVSLTMGKSRSLPDS
jgi:RNA polymerase-associated protein CTR9